MITSVCPPVCLLCCLSTSCFFYPPVLSALPSFYPPVCLPSCLVYPPVCLLSCRSALPSACPPVCGAVQHLLMSGSCSLPTAWGTPVTHAGTKGPHPIKLYQLLPSPLAPFGLNQTHCLALGNYSLESHSDFFLNLARVREAEALL